MIDFYNNWFQGFKSESLMNVTETEKAYTIELRAVGLKKDEIKISFEDDVLVVKSEKKNDGENWLRHEFWNDSIDKRIIIPGDSDRDNVKAKVEDGILKIEIPKTESKKSVITIE